MSKTETTIIMQKYPEYYQHLISLMKELNVEIPETMKGFKQLHQASMAEGKISSKNKELIAVGIAIAIRCEGCIAFHVKDALKAGATREEIIESIGVAVMMGGGPALMYGCEALQALQEFLEKRTTTID